MMLCSEDTSTNHLSQDHLYLLKEYLMCGHLHKIYLTRQIVCAKPGGTGPVPSAASWCSPFGWHSENCPHAHPGKQEQRDEAANNRKCAHLR